MYLEKIMELEIINLSDESSQSITSPEPKKLKGACANIDDESKSTDQQRLVNVCIVVISRYGQVGRKLLGKLY